MTTSPFSSRLLSAVAGLTLLAVPRLGYARGLEVLKGKLAPRANAKAYYISPDDVTKGASRYNAYLGRRQRNRDFAKMVKGLELSGELTTHKVTEKEFAVKGKDGEDLSIHTLLIQATDPKELFVFKTGVHGAENEHSNAMKQAFIEEFLPLLGDHVSVLFIDHADPVAEVDGMRVHDRQQLADDGSVMEEGQDGNRSTFRTAVIPDGLGPTNADADAEHFGGLALTGPAPSLKEHAAAMVGSVAWDLVKHPNIASITKALGQGQSKNNGLPGFNGGGARSARQAELEVYQDQVAAAHEGKADGILPIDYHSGVGQGLQVMATPKIAGTNADKGFASVYNAVAGVAGLQVTPDEKAEYDNAGDTLQHWRALAAKYGMAIAPATVEQGTKTQIEEIMSEATVSHALRVMKYGAKGEALDADGKPIPDENNPIRQEMYRNMQSVFVPADGTGTMGKEDALRQFRALAGHYVKLLNEGTWANGIAPEPYQLLPIGK